MRKEYAPSVVLANWKTLSAALPHMEEKELEKALKQEVAGEKRKDFIIRLHRKFTRIRKERELKEYLP